MNNTANQNNLFNDRCFIIAVDNLLNSQRFEQVWIKKDHTFRTCFKIINGIVDIKLVLIDITLQTSCQHRQNVNMLQRESFLQN